MRGLIIDYARSRQTQKRGGDFEITSLGRGVATRVAETGSWSRIGAALDELAAAEPALAEVVDLKFFCGFSFGEIAAMRDVSERTVQRQWEKARIYLHRDDPGGRPRRDRAAVKPCRDSSRERWQAVSPYLDQALELAGDERARVARRAPRAAIRRSPPISRRSSPTHRSSAGKASSKAASPFRPAGASLAGQTFGAYTLVSLIGQGGMGSVWLARRSDGRFEGQAAVKLLNASLVGRAGEERFRREGSILARLAHPHIARLVDAGVSPAGQPYLVLEHVEGEPIDRYCDRQAPRRRRTASDCSSTCSPPSPTLTPT